MPRGDPKHGAEAAAGLQWASPAPLLADDCVAAEVDGLVALEARKATPGWWTRLLGGAPTNRVEYANELEPLAARVSELRDHAHTPRSKAVRLVRS